MRNGHFTVLVAALLLIGNLVLDLDAAGTGFDHALGQQVGGFRVAETGVDVGDDRDDVGFVVVDLRLDLGGLGFVAGFAGSVQSGEQQVQLAAVSLAQEGVQLLDQVGNGSLLMHRLVRQRAELGTQGGDHPAGEVEVAFVGGLQVLLDGDQLLLTDEAMPATQRLRVNGRVGVVLGHVLAHDVGGVLSDFQTGLEAVLSAHASHGLRVDSAPAASSYFFQSGNGLDVVLISGHGQSFQRNSCLVEHRLSHRNLRASADQRGNTQQSVEIPTGTRIEPRRGGVCSYDRKRPASCGMIVGIPAHSDTGSLCDSAVLTSRADTLIASPSLGTTRSSRNLVSPPCGQYSHGSALLVG